MPVVFSDSDFAGNVDDRRSVSGCVVFLCGAPVVWRCHSQHLVTLSTAEAETVALTDSVTEVVWLRSLLHDMGYPQTKPTLVLVDNTAAIAIANNEHGSRRTKHFDTRHKYNGQCIRLGITRVQHVASDANLADFFTKPLPADRFRALRAALTRTLSGSV